jgi:serine/threonine protein kinase
MLRVDVVEKILCDKGDEGIVYCVKDAKNEIRAIKVTCLPNNFEEVKFEELIKGWKKSQEISDHIVYYYDHWYGNKYVYIVMEYCSNGDLSKEEQERIENKKKFSEIVFFFLFFFFFLFIYLFNL